MLGKSIAISGGVATVVLVVILQLTTPSTIGPLGLLFVFILMYIMMVSVLTSLLFGVSRAVGRITRALMVRRPLPVLTLQRAYYYGSVVALAPVMLIGMQSVGAVGFNEVLLVILFVAFACFYIAKRSD